MTRSSVRGRTRLLALSATLWTSSLAAQTKDGAGSLFEPDTPSAQQAGVRWLPGDTFYPLYLADPQAPLMSVQFMKVQGERIPATGASRVGLMLGVRFGVLRITPKGAPDRPWQIDGELGFREQADPHYDLDDIGWDGSYSLLLSRALSRRFQFHFGTKHLSAHLGDEYVERTGRARVGYTRDEITLGGIAAVGAWTTYLEANVSFNLRTRAEQERWRVQGGVQREALPPEGQGRRGWYAAANVEVLQELGWKPDLCLQGGLVVRAGHQRWRFGVQVYDGKVPLGEFTRSRETYLSAGLWLSL